MGKEIKRRPDEMPGNAEELETVHQIVDKKNLLEITQYEFLEAST
jgi:hypothetical protein